MNPSNRTYADVVKKSSALLNTGMDPTPLIPKVPRVHLSEDAKSKLRLAIKSESNTEVKAEKSVKSVKSTGKSSKEKAGSNHVINSSQPLILATASDWVMTGSDMRKAIYDMKKEPTSLSAVRLLTSEEKRWVLL